MHVAWSGKDRDREVAKLGNRRDETKLRNLPHRKSAAQVPGSYSQCCAPPHR